jgi:hypothetical protein
MLKEEGKTDATVIANCIRELEQLQDPEAQARALKALAVFFGVDWPQVVSRPPRPPGGMTFRYGTPFP